MKKKIGFISILFVMLLILTGCGNKTAITTSKFISLTESEGYTISDVKDQFDEDYLKEATVAMGDGYQIEFYVLDSEFNAKNMFKYNKKIFLNYKGGLTSEVSSEVGNYSTYSLQSDGYYMYLSRVDNTLIYVRVESKYKDNVKNTIDKLGY